MKYSLFMGIMSGVALTALAADPPKKAPEPRPGGGLGGPTPLEETLHEDGVGNILVYDDKIEELFVSIEGKPAKTIYENLVQVGKLTEEGDRKNVVNGESLRCVKQGISELGGGVTYRYECDFWLHSNGKARPAERRSILIFAAQSIRYMPTVVQYKGQEGLALTLNALPKYPGDPAKKVYQHLLIGNIAKKVPHQKEGASYVGESFIGSRNVSRKPNPEDPENDILTVTYHAGAGITKTGKLVTQ